MVVPRPLAEVGPEKPKHTSSIKSVVDLGSEKINEGVLRTIGVTSMRGYNYAVAIGVPKEPRTDVPTIATSAWFTSLHGHNEHTIRRFMRAGFPIVFAGAEGSYHHGMASPDMLAKITLEHSAEVLLDVAGDVILDGPHAMPIDTDLNRRTLIGESRGAMVGMGVVAMAQEHGQTIDYADLTAPCFPKSFELTMIPRLAMQEMTEVLSISRLMYSLPARLKMRLASTVDMDPVSLTCQMGIAPCLLSGEAGDLARRIERGQPMHITAFNRDGMSMISEWRKIFENYSDVIITPLDGSHLTLVDPETLEFVLARREAVHMISERGMNVSANLVSMLSHQIINSRSTVTSSGKRKFKK